MKPLLTFAAIAFLGLPLTAEEMKQKKVPAPTETAVNPLVAAARRTNRAASKTPVITDASVKNAKGGHVTSTTNITPPRVPIPRPSPEVIHNEQRAAGKAAEATKAAADQKKEDGKKDGKQRLAAAAQEYEGGYDDGDPTHVERELSEATGSQTAPKKP